jgi:hypothetical protein
MDIRFWMLLSELNSLTTILSVKCPEYEQRITLLKSELTDIINEGLEQSKKLNNIDNWYVRNN